MAPIFESSPSTEAIVQQQWRWSNPYRQPVAEAADDLTVAISRTSTTVVVTVAGCLDAASARVLDGLLRDLIVGQGNLSLTVDLRDASVVDPASLAVIRTAAQLAARRGGAVTVADGRAAGEITV